MAFESDPTKNLAETLDAKGVTGLCPMCRHNNWRTTEKFPYSQIRVASFELEPVNIYSGTFPTYWMYCLNCGFMAHFLKSVVDGSVEPEKEELQP
jgi:hypothetical protein